MNQKSLWLSALTQDCNWTCGLAGQKQYFRVRVGREHHVTLQTDGHSLVGCVVCFVCLSAKRTKRTKYCPALDSWHIWAALFIEAPLIPVWTRVNPFLELFVRSECSDRNPRQMDPRRRFQRWFSLEGSWWEVPILGLIMCVWGSAAFTKFTHFFPGNL